MFVQASSYHNSVFHIASRQAVLSDFFCLELSSSVSYQRTVLFQNCFRQACQFHVCTIFFRFVTYDVLILQTCLLFDSPCQDLFLFLDVVIFRSYIV